ncbi:phosphoserine transaminase [Brevundimonas sp. 2R-24]|uniref:phosphoserine transaminase n=1 Tax=Peiella sedimenti TaxID=3061083 RepID=A0ABT8SM17_9CAUL|nr:phosphoserine transaminase [Caulobacteraceae bacterium XZ-24]
MSLSKPNARPDRPWFSSGPTAKPLGWSPEALSTALIGRTSRAEPVNARFREALALTREVLEIPADYRLAFVPGSDTGAFEAALWNLLGPRPIEVIAFEAFGNIWAEDVTDQLGLKARVRRAAFGGFPDVSGVDPEADIVFTWNGTTSGVRVPNVDFIPEERGGLTFCDATSAAFAMPLDWDRLDATTFSFQKALGGEAGLGVLVLSPRAVQRLEAGRQRPIPKAHRLTTADGRLDEAIFEGIVTNTSSFLTLEDWVWALNWCRQAGGLREMIARTNRNAAALGAWVQASRWAAYLPDDPAVRSTTSICLKITEPRVAGLSEAERHAFVREMTALLEAEGAAFDVGSHRAAPAGLRIWCGPTVETTDVEALGSWLDWAFHTALEARLSRTGQSV